MANTLIQAIKDIGGISKRRLETAGTLSEWLDLPSATRTQIFRENSTQDADEVVAQLPGYGICNLYSGNDLLVWLRDPLHQKLDSQDVALVAQLENAIRERDAEIESLKAELAEIQIMMERPADGSFADMARLGGRARANKLSPERRQEIARKAAQARYAKKHETERVA